MLFAALMLLSISLGINRYSMAEDSIRSDLDMALSKAMQHNQGDIVSNDTIQAFKHLAATADGDVSVIISDNCFARFISISQLKENAFISLSLANGKDIAKRNGNAENMIVGDTLLLRHNAKATKGLTIALNGCAKCSFTTVLSLSDQRLPMALMGVAMAWGLFSLAFFKRNRMRMAVCGTTNGLIEFTDNQQQCKNENHAVGNVLYKSGTKQFVTTEGKEMCLTPMQHELMLMLFEAPCHRMMKSEICDALWPGKDDASDTLYALIKRLKTNIEKQCNLSIESERGFAYRLEIKNRD